MAETIPNKITVEVVGESVVVAHDSLLDDMRRQRDLIRTKKERMETVLHRIRRLKRRTSQLVNEYDALYLDVWIDGTTLYGMEKKEWRIKKLLAAWRDHGVLAGFEGQRIYVGKEPITSQGESLVILLKAFASTGKEMIFEEVKAVAMAANPHLPLQLSQPECSILRDMKLIRRGTRPDNDSWIIAKLGCKFLTLEPEMVSRRKLKKNGKTIGGLIEFTVGDWDFIMKGRHFFKALWTQPGKVTVRKNRVKPKAKKWAALVGTMTDQELQALIKMYHRVYTTKREPKDRKALRSWIENSILTMPMDKLFYVFGAGHVLYSSTFPNGVWVP